MSIIYKNFHFELPPTHSGCYYEQKQIQITLKNIPFAYLTVHYPTDVLASVVFGSAYGGAAYLLMKKVLEKPGRLRKVLVEGASYKTLWKK